MVEGNLAKFSQISGRRDYLLSTAPKVLVEASATDLIWGIGLAASDEATATPNSWRGENLLGFALMDVRDGLTRPPMTTWIVSRSVPVRAGTIVLVII